MVKRNLQLDVLSEEGEFQPISPLASRTSDVPLFDLDAPSAAPSSSRSFACADWKNEKMKNRIYDEFCRGIGVKELSRKFGRAIASIYRIVGARKAAKVFETPIEYIPSPEFDRAFGVPRAEAQILDFSQNSERSRENAAKTNDANGSNASDDVRKRAKRRAVATGSSDESSAYWARIDDVPLLTPEEEMSLFRKFNYLKYKAKRLRDALDPKRPKLILADEIEKLWNEAVATKKRIVSANLRLVVSVAKKYAGGSTSFADLVGDGNVSLVKAVEKFDYTTGNRFSTYATWALYRNFARSIPDEQKQLDRFRASDVELLELKQDYRTSPRQAERVYREQTSQVARFMSELSDREREIIELRFGIGGRAKPQTLRQVGKDMGVTKERVRQIEMRALAKLRKVAQEENFELPELYRVDT